MPLPPPHKKCKRRHVARNESHPYVIKINIKMAKIDQIMKRIYELADNDLLVTDAKSGLNDFSMNMAYVKKLENLSKKLYKLGDEIAKKSAVLQEKIDEAVDRKDNMREIIFIEEITDWSQKSNEAQNQTKIERFKRSDEYRIKQETLDSSDDDIEPDTNFQGDPDAHFTYSKVNENDSECHSYKCDLCDDVFRDYNDLRNHDSHHKVEFFRCMICLKVFRSLRSFETHHKSHDSSYSCDICSKQFNLKTSLTNHLPVHSTERMHCTHPGCQKSFKHRANQLEHIQWAHRKEKECPCNICKKLFQMPSVMRAHRLRQHGSVSDITPGYRLSQTTNPTKPARKPGPKPKNSKNG